MGAAETVVKVVWLDDLDMGMFGDRVDLDTLDADFALGLGVWGVGNVGEAGCIDGALNVAGCAVGTRVAALGKAILTVAADLAGSTRVARDAGKTTLAHGDDDVWVPKRVYSTAL